VLVLSLLSLLQEPSGFWLLVVSRDTVVSVRVQLWLLYSIEPFSPLLA
jgi:hypothetical protein